MDEKLRRVSKALGMPLAQRSEDGALLFVINDDRERVFVYRLDFGSGKLAVPQPTIGTRPVCEFPVERLNSPRRRRQLTLAIEG